MNDLEKKSIECIKNMPIEEATYQVARSVVLDYIINLQEENNNLKEDFKRHIDRINELTERSDNLQEENRKFKEYAKNYLKSKIDRKNEELELVKTKFIEEHNKCLDYKSRNEKAIEYINNWLFEVGGNGACMDYEDIVEMKNILQGDDKE